MPEGDHRPIDTRRARELRRATTMPEAILWKRLRARRLDNWKFRRQQPIGVYTADFYCAKAKLVVEVDSRAHDDRLEHDRTRDEWMRAEGIETLRVTASDIAKRPDDVLTHILNTVERRAIEIGAGEENPSPQPSPPRGEGANPNLSP
jgi:very-short-patch-repair endonuclease